MAIGATPHPGSDNPPTPEEVQLRDWMRIRDADLRTVASGLRDLRRGLWFLGVAVSGLVGLIVMVL